MRGCIATVSCSIPNPISIHLVCVVTAESTHTHTYIYFTSSLDFSPCRCPRSFCLLYHQRQYLLTGRNVLAAIVVWRNAAVQPFYHLLPSVIRSYSDSSPIFLFPSCLSYLSILFILLFLLPP